MNGEVLVLDRTTGKIFQLPHENTTTLKVPVKASVKFAETQEESKNNMYILLMIIMMVAGILFFIKNKGEKVIKQSPLIIRQISLYQQHQST